MTTETRTDSLTINRLTQEQYEAITPSNTELYLVPDESSSTINYNDLTNKPKINNVELSANKTLSDLNIYSKTEVNSALAGKQATISDLATIRSGAGLGATSLQPADIINSTTSTATDKALSANIGKELQDQITNLNTRGKYLSLWDCTTGLAMDSPPVDPYVYETGSFFIVGKIASSDGTNYRPVGSTYSESTPSTTVETADVKVNDTYYYDGTVWRLLHTEQPTVAFSVLAGSPYDNSNLSTALNSKQNSIYDLDTIRSGAYAGMTALQTIPDWVLTDTSYATDSTGGVFKTSSSYGTTMDSGVLTGVEKTYGQYLSTALEAFISKGTLENVFTGKQFVDKIYTDNLVATKESPSNKVTSLSASSTNTQYPSAKCVYDLVGNVEDLLEALL